jgi:hypothetical protein
VAVDGDVEIRVSKRDAGDLSDVALRVSNGRKEEKGDRDRHTPEHRERV